MLDRTLTDRIYESIKSYNTSEHDPSVPMSDQFMKDFSSAEGYSESETRTGLMILNEAHKVFVIAISKENKQTGSKKIDGYVIADEPVISSLRSIYQRRLTELYNKEKGTHYGYPQIQKEILSRMNALVNTPVGRVANIAIMLNEYQNLITKHPEEFTYEWCEAKLDEYLKHVPIVDESEPEEQGGDASSRDGVTGTATRAVDSPEFEVYSKDDKTLSPQKMLTIYGADFFFRVKLRKYEFKLLKDMIVEGQIKRKTDMSMLRGMIKTIKGNFDRDPKLNDYFEDIYHLDRELSKKLYFSAR